MGKSKGKKKGQVKSGGSPYEARAPTSEPASESSGIIGDLQSLEESKRVNACKMLVGLFESGSAPIESLASEKVLVALSQRLVDTSEVVRLEAAGALHNMASTLNSNIGRRMVTGGVFSTAVGLIKSMLEGGGDDAVLHTLLSKESARRVLEQLLACIAGIVASHDIDEPNSGLLDSQFYRILLNMCKQRSSLEIAKVTVDLLAVLTDDSAHGCEALCTQNGITVIKEVMFGLESNNGAASPSKTSLLQLGMGNVMLNIFTTLPNAQVHCEMLVIFKAAFNKLAIGEDVKNQILEQSNDESIKDALEVIKVASELVSNSALIGKLPTGGEDTQMTEAECQCATSALAVEISQHLQTAGTALFLLDSLAFYFQLIQSMIAKQIPVNIHSIYILDTFERISSALTNILGASSQSLIATTDIQSRLELVTSMGELFLDGATNTTVYVDDKGKRNTQGLWPVEETIDYQIAMNGFTSACAILLDIISHLSQAHALSVDLLKKISTFLCRAISSPNYDILSKGVGTAISISTSCGNFPMNLHALLTNSLLRRMGNPTSFRLSVNEGVIDTTLLAAGVCVEGVIDMHSDDGVEALAHFAKFNSIDKLSECYRNVQQDFQKFSNKELEESGELSHLIEVMENVEPFVEYKRRAINNAKI